MIPIGVIVDFTRYISVSVGMFWQWLITEMFRECLVKVIPRGKTCSYGSSRTEERHSAVRGSSKMLHEVIESTK